MPAVRHAQDVSTGETGVNLKLAGSYSLRLRERWALSMRTRTRSAWSGYQLLFKSGRSLTEGCARKSTIGFRGSNPICRNETLNAITLRCVAFACTYDATIAVRRQSWKVNPDRSRVSCRTLPFNKFLIKLSLLHQKLRVSDSGWLAAWRWLRGSIIVRWFV